MDVGPGASATPTDVAMGASATRSGGAQSSELPAQLPSPRPNPRQSAAATRGWQRAEKLVVCSTPLQPPLNGCGGAHRSFPRGAAANGTPRNTSDRGRRFPLREPPSGSLTSTGGAGGAGGLSQHSYEYDASYEEPLPSYE